mmetsp:Transcript_75797/g.202988  ORF Transcript_75797/g.202988 Transcript_75797/m.202988 type:complete len:212 (+) Transcript_75797:101-736(+)
MVMNGGNLPDSSASETPSRRGWNPELTRISAAVMVIMSIGVLMVLSGSSNPGAIEMLSNHHKAKSIDAKVSSALDDKDKDRLKELSQLASAAQTEAQKAAALKSSEAQKLRITPESKVDAELMLSREAEKKSKLLEKNINVIHKKLTSMRKILRKDNHAAREEGRLLHKIDGGLRDSMLSLHDKEMKVVVRVKLFLWSRNDQGRFSRLDMT